MLQGDVSTGDLVLGAAVLAVALPAIAGAGYVVYRVKNARFARAWAPLARLLGGPAVTGDGGGGATSWLSGTYRGARVVASMAHDVRSYNATAHSNWFTVTLRDVPGRDDWSLAWDGGLPGFGAKGFRIRTDAPGLAERLEAAGALALAGRLGRPELAYRARAAELTLREDVRPRWAPPPERFRDELEALLELAAVNAAANAP